MSDSKGATRATGMNVDTKLVRELAELLAETGLTEIEVEDGERKIKVARQSLPVAAVQTMAAPPAPAVPLHAAASSATM